MEMFSYDDAVEFCRRATKLLAREKTDFRQANCPAARAKPSGNTPAELAPIRRIRLATTRETRRVRLVYRNAGATIRRWAKQPNALKLFDMHGYCGSGVPTPGTTTIPGHRPTVRPGPPAATPTARYFRGGSWKDPADRLTSSFRRAGLAGPGRRCRPAVRVGRRAASPIALVRLFSQLLQFT